MSAPEYYVTAQPPTNPPPARRRRWSTGRVLIATVVGVVLSSVGLVTWVVVHAALQVLQALAGSAPLLSF